MHLPPYSHATIRSALPTVPTSRQVGGLDCCLCDEPFDGKAPIPLGPTETSGLFGCRPCLQRLVARARRKRYTALVEKAEDERAVSVRWAETRGWYLAGLEGVRKAAESVAQVARESEVEALRTAWLLISLESAHDWATDKAPEPPASVGDSDTEIEDASFRLSLEMISAREAVAHRLVYHLINESAPADPDMCAEFECPEDCSGRHDTDHIDCGPDEVFDELHQHGITVEREKPGVTPHHRTPPPYDTPLDPGVPEMIKELPSLLRHLGIDPDDSETVLSAAAVGLVREAWRDGPLDTIHASDNGPSDGDIFAQSVDLYRRARAALLEASEDGPDALLAFQAVAADVDLPWAGDSRFTLRASGEPTEDFIQHLDGRVWFTAKVMQEHGWRDALLHRASIGAFKAPASFGMPRWPKTVARALEHLEQLNRSDAPTALDDLAAVEIALLEAPDRLGVGALDWLSARIPLG